MAKADPEEIEFITGKLVEKVWQGDQAKAGLARQAASVALAAMQDFTYQMFMQPVSPTIRARLINEARASVALDKGYGETFSVEQCEECNGPCRIQDKVSNA